MRHLSRIFVIFLSIGIIFPTFNTQSSANTSFEEVKIGFVGDQGFSNDARRVLQMMVNEGVDVISLGGDFGYDEDEDDSPQEWFDMHYDIVYTDTPNGKVLTIPILAAIGNHDVDQWEDFIGEDNIPRTGYKNYLIRMYNDYKAYEASNPDALRLECTFKDDDINQIAINHRCSVENVEIVYSGIGEIDPPQGQTDDYFLEYIEDSLEAADTTWKVCTWHRNNNLLQLGDKQYDSIGYTAYNLCRKYGAIAATHHEHSYARTHIIDHYSAGTGDLSNAMSVTLESFNNNGELIRLRDHSEDGNNVTFVSGLGGKNIRTERAARDNNARWLTSYPWWASYSVDRDSNRNQSHHFFHVDTLYSSYTTLNASQSTLPNKTIGDVSTRDIYVRDGALLCEFNTDGDPTQGLCEFINVGSTVTNTKVIDRFELVSEVDGISTSSAPVADIALIGENFFYQNLTNNQTVTLNYVLTNNKMYRVDEADIDIAISGVENIHTLQYKTSQMSDYQPLVLGTIQLEDLGLDYNDQFEFKVRFTVDPEISTKTAPLSIDADITSEIADQNLSNNSFTNNFTIYQQ